MRRSRSGSGLLLPGPYFHHEYQAMSRLRERAEQCLTSVRWPGSVTCLWHLPVQITISQNISTRQGRPVAVAEHDETQTWSRTQNTKRLPVWTKASDSRSFTGDSSGLAPSRPLCRAHLRPQAPELSLHPTAPTLEHTPRSLNSPQTRPTTAQTLRSLLSDAETPHASPRYVFPWLRGTSPPGFTTSVLLVVFGGHRQLPNTHFLSIYLTPKPAPREHQGQQHTLALDRAGLNLSLATYCVTRGKLSYLSEPRSLCYEIVSCLCLGPQSGSPLVQS